jgi:aminoglycoside 6'-N-acetyltransferase I
VDFLQAALLPTGSPAVLCLKPMTYAKIQSRDIDACLAMALTLWTDAKPKEIRDIFKAGLRSGKQTTYVCRNEQGEAIAFMNITIRRDYVEGSETSPVGYVEGIYVKAKYRKQGVAKHLITLAEKWSRAHGCKELGSDAYANNKASAKFHAKVGFEHAGLIAHFIKKL